MKRQLTARLRLTCACGALFALALGALAAGCGPRQTAPSGATPAPAGGPAFDRVQKIETSGDYRAAMLRFVAERKKADPALKDLVLDTASILLATVRAQWVEQSEEARDKWALALATAFSEARAAAGIPVDEEFKPTVKVFLEGGGIVAEVWRGRTRHYR